MLVSLRQEVRTCTSHCDYSLHLYHPASLIRHMHIILKSKLQNTRWTGPQLVKPLFLLLWPTVAGPQTGWIPHTKQSWTSWERWLGRISYYCCLWISGPQHMGSSPMSAGWKIPYMDSTKHHVLGMLKLINTWWVLDSIRVMSIPTYTTRSWMVIHLF